MREFVGAITYRVQGRSKVVQFWRMQAALHPTHDLMKDIAAVEWLPLAKAVRRLSYPLEKLFLRNVGQQSLKPRRRKAARKRSVAKASKSAAKSAKRRLSKRRPTRRV